MKWWGPGLNRGDASSSNDSSWFGPVGVTESTPELNPTSDDSPFWTARIRRMLRGGSDTHRRIFLTYLVARTGLGLVLCLAQAALAWLLGRGNPVVFAVCVVYAFEGLGWWIFAAGRVAEARRLSAVHWWATIGVDILAFGFMHWMEVGAVLNYGALLILPVLMAGVLSSRLPALATAAGVTILLLAAGVHKGLLAGDLLTPLSQAGLGGAGVFLIALVAGQMTQRLAREEQAARNSLEMALQQAELNRLVIDEMADGVLVVDRNGRVRAANPAAQQLLSDTGVCPRPPFMLGQEPGWKSLESAVRSAYEAGRWPSPSVDLAVSSSGEVPRQIRVRARFTRGFRLPVPNGQPVGKTGGNEVLAVLFAEELRHVLARERQERLVAMGRISAGVAHEIRNPLAAVAQANALLQEDVLRPDQQRLVRIIADNVDRLRRIVEDVLEAAPGAHAPSRNLDASAEVGNIVADWAQTVGLALGSQSRLKVRMPSGPLGIAFDTDHLRRVLINLLDNAMRHSTDQPGAMLMVLEPLDTDFVRVAVSNDGVPIPEDVEPHLFEPFHSTRSRGTGLGLYICRELCARHGAIIEYVRQAGARRCNQFMIVMRRAEIPAEGRLHL